MKRQLLVLAIAGLVPLAAEAFCGFYVAKADTKLFNKASQVVLVRDEEKTVMTMANDFEGDPKEFAVVIPVPTFLEKSQIHVGDKALIDHLDAYSAPRLVEYFDPDPCRPMPMMDFSASRTAAVSGAMAAKSERAKALGVTVEATYTIGEYDILILSANESDGLETWLKENGYKIPEGAAPVLNSYIKQKVRFFVAKVNLEEQAKAGFTYLRPIQVAFNSPKFMLPIRLGTVNANGTQELFIYTLTRKGRVETTNYRTVKLPTGMEIPVFVKEEFGDFYKAMFDRLVKKEDMRCVFTEYAWDTSWCDPCASDPPSKEELKKLGVFWLDEADGPRKQARILPFRGGQSDVFLTRLHVRYDREHFPEDLVFQETGDRDSFQGRYVLRHPWKGKADCDGARRYEEQLPARADKEAQTLSMLTGWDIEKIRERMKLAGPAPKTSNGKWWEKLWK
jgi:hypothetical protein